MFTQLVFGQSQDLNPGLLTPSPEFDFVFPFESVKNFVVYRTTVDGRGEHVEISWFNQKPYNTTKTLVPCVAISTVICCISNNITSFLCVKTVFLVLYVDCLF